MSGNKTPKRLQVQAMQATLESIYDWDLRMEAERSLERDCLGKAYRRIQALQKQDQEQRAAAEREHQREEEEREEEKRVARLAILYERTWWKTGRERRESI